MFSQGSFQDRLMTSLLDLPQRIPLGPDPSNVHPRVFKALSARVVGRLNTEFFKAHWFEHLEKTLQIHSASVLIAFPITREKVLPT